MFDILARLLSFFFQLTNSYGVAIILLTVAVRLVLFPLTAKQTRSMAAMSRVQPQVKKLQAEHKDDRQKLNEELMKFYKQEGINPAAGCLPLVLQIPVFIALFRVIRGLSHSGQLAWLQIRVPKPSYISSSSEMYRAIVRSGGRLVSWGFDLAQSAAGVGGSFRTRLPYVLLVVGYAVSGWIQQAMATKKNPQAATGQAAQMQSIMKIFPIFMAIFSYSMPAGLVVYWLASNIWTIGQQELLFRTMPKVAASEAVIEVRSTQSRGSSSMSERLGKAINELKGKSEAAKSEDSAPGKSIAAKGAETKGARTKPAVTETASAKLGSVAPAKASAPRGSTPKDVAAVGAVVTASTRKVAGGKGGASGSAATPDKSGKDGLPVKVTPTPGSNGVPQVSRPAKPQAAKRKGR